jgi:Ca2+-binding EF-hand superfamily protein
MKTALVTAATVALASSAFGQDQTARERRMFRALDADNDGRISVSEARWAREALDRFTGNDSASGGSTAGARASKPASALFRRTDRNNDGYLSENELWQAPVPRGGGWITMDRDHDGRIGPTEFTSVDSVRARQ